MKKLYLSFKIRSEGTVKTLEYNEDDTVKLAEVMEEILRHASVMSLSTEEKKDRDEQTKANNEMAAWMLLYQCNITDDIESDKVIPGTSPCTPCPVNLVAVLDTVEDHDCTALSFLPSKLLDTSFFCNGSQFVVQQGNNKVHLTQYTLSIYPINTPCQHTLLIHPINISYQYILLIHSHALMTHSFTRHTV